MSATVKGLGGAYTVEIWFCNHLPNDARPVTGYVFSRGDDGAPGAPGDHLGIGGTHSATGRLIVYNGDALKEMVAGTTEIRPKTWYHVAMVRDGRKIAVYLNGRKTPEIAGEVAMGCASDVQRVFLGGRSDSFANFEGRIDEVAVYDRPLRADEIARHYFAARGVPAASRR